MNNCQVLVQGVVCAVSNLSVKHSDNVEQLKTEKISVVNFILTNVTHGSLVTWCTLANIGSNTSSSILTFGTTNWCLLFNNSCTKTKRKYA